MAKEEKEPTDVEIISEENAETKQDIKTETKENKKSNSKIKDISTEDKGQVFGDVPLNFMDNNFVSDFVKKSTTESADNKEEKKESQFDNSKTTEELRDQIIKEEKDYVNQFSVQDFEDIATFLIELVDTGISSGCRWYAKDTSDKAYTFSIEKKRILIKQLTMVLVKYQIKWNIAVLFFLTLIVMTISPIKKARENRKLNQRSLEQENDNYNENEQTKQKPLISEEFNPDLIKTSKPKFKPPVRKAGNPGRA